MGKAYHASRNRIGEYELEWLETPLETPLEPDVEVAPRKRIKPRTKTGEIKKR